jgi:HlyD family secretion protein
MAVSRKGKFIIGGSIFALLVLITIISIFATRTDTPEVTVVKIETRKELRSQVTASGEIRPIQFINLTSEVQGRIEEIYVSEGDRVTQGQELVRLDKKRRAIEQVASSRRTKSTFFGTARFICRAAAG